MQEPAGQSRLQRILNYRFFGKPREMPAKRDFDELSHSEQQEAMLWGERSVADLPIYIAIFLSAVTSAMGYAIGIMLSEICNFSGSPFPQTFDADERTLMYQIFSVYIVSVAVLVLLILYCENPARWLVCRWPKKFADTNEPATREHYKKVMRTMLISGGVVLLFLVFMVVLIEGWSELLISLAVMSPLILMMWFVYRGATRSGAEPCCRKCGYSLPLSDPLPERCSECGIGLTETWGRVLGQSRRKGLWWIHFGLLVMLPVAIGAAFWTFR